MIYCLSSDHPLPILRFHYPRRNANEVKRQYSEGRRKGGVKVSNLNPSAYYLADDCSSDSVTLQLDSVVGSFAFRKMSGSALREQLSVKFPSGSTDLTQAPPARRYNIIAQEQIDSSQQTQTCSCYRKFAKVIPVRTAERLKTLFREMVLKGLKHSEKDLDYNRASTSRAWHFGIWQKYAKRPQITADTKDQNEAVTILLKEFLTIISTDIAPQVARLYEKYYPTEWKTQQMYVPFKSVFTCFDLFSRAWGRVKSIFKKKLLEHPYLDFGGAFFAIAVKEGSSDVDHLDWTDGLDNITFVTAVG